MILHRKPPGVPRRDATVAEELARFAAERQFADLSNDAVRALRIRVLDSLACALGALRAEPIRRLRLHIEDLGGTPHCTLLGGGRTAPDRAALYNGALVRYLAPGETCHPSDNFAAVLAACEYAGGSGKDLLTALAVAYQVQCRLSDEAPVRERGFDHVTQGAFAAAAGVARALGLEPERAAHAIAIAGTAFNALRVTRTGRLSHWKGLAGPHAASAATHAAFLALRGITGPTEVFEGNKGWIQSVSGPFQLDWGKENLERVTGTVLKKFNAEVHSQSATEGLLELQRDAGFAAADVDRVEVEIFDVAYHIIGGGEEGPKTDVRTKEEADHSLNYILAVALLDGKVMPAQYEPDRIVRDDVRALVRCIEVRPDDAFSRRFPAEMPCRLRVRLRNGRVCEREQRDYEGFVSRPMRWESVVAKFDELGAPFAGAGLRREIVEAVAALEGIRVAELAALLGRVGRRGG